MTMVATSEKETAEMPGLLATEMFHWKSCWSYWIELDFWPRGQLDRGRLEKLAEISLKLGIVNWCSMEKLPQLLVEILC